MAVMRISTLLVLVVADIPVHCQIGDFLGQWTMSSTAPTPFGQASPDVPNFQDRAGMGEKYCHFGHPNKNAENLENMGSSALFGDRLQHSRSFNLTDEVMMHPDQSSTLKVDIDGYNPPAGKVNSWSTVYDEGWRIEAHDNDGLTSFFALSAYDCLPGNDHCGKAGDNENHLGKTAGYKSLCGKALAGWYSSPAGHGCFAAQKVGAFDAEKEHAYVFTHMREHPGRSLIEVHSVYHGRDFAHEGGKEGIFELPPPDQVLKLHEQEGGLSNKSTAIHRSGVVKQYWGGKPQGMMHVVDQCQAEDLAFDSLIEQYEQADPVWDWRAKYGNAWNTPIEDQGSCGSCYAVAAKYSLGSRANIAVLKDMEARGEDLSSFQAMTPSAHSVLACSYYNQGCQGGFPFAVAQHAKDFGIPTESCQPYGSAGSGQVDACNAECFQDPSKVLYAKEFKYAAGFYGSCGQARIMQDLKEHGPMAVAVEVSRDIRSNRGDSVSGESFLQMERHEKTPDGHVKGPHGPAVSLLEARWGLKADQGCKSAATGEHVDEHMREQLGKAYVNIAPHSFGIYLDDMPRASGSLYRTAKQHLATATRVEPDCVHLELVAGSLNSWEYTDHAITLVGWGAQKVDSLLQTEEGTAEKVGDRLSKYWIIRNSWGPGYGDGGYAYVARGVNYAGIESQAVLLSPDPDRGWLQAQLQREAAYIELSEAPVEKKQLLRNAETFRPEARFQGSTMRRV